MSSRRSCTRAVAAVVGGLLLMLAPGCEDEQSWSCPAPTLGVIEGFVLGGGRPIQGIVVAEPIDDHRLYDSDLVSTAQTDSTGWYTLLVPAGDYTLQLDSSGWYRHDGIAWSRSEADTLTVGHRATRADFVGGNLVVNLTTPGATSGQGIACTAWWMNESGHGWRETSRVEANGESATFDFPFLPAGSYALTYREGAGPELWLPASYLADAADRIEVASGEPQVYSSLLPQPTRLEVAIEGSWQLLGLGVPRVDVYTPDSVSLGGLPTDGAETWRWLIRAPVTFCLRVSIGGVTRWIGGWTLAEARTFAIAPGGPAVQVLERESALLCTLVGPGDTFDHDAAYSLYDEGGRRVVSVSTYSLSRVRPAPLPNLPVGTYYLRVDPIGWGELTWLPQWFDQGDSLAVATPIPIAEAGQAIPVTIRLVDGGRISGHVFEGDGTPYDGPLRVRLASDPETDYRVVQTDGATGAYLVTTLPDGDYLLAIHYGWARLCWYPGTMSIAAAMPVQMRNHDHLENVDWQIP